MILRTYSEKSHIADCAQKTAHYRDGLGTALYALHEGDQVGGDGRGISAEIETGRSSLASNLGPEVDKREIRDLVLRSQRDDRAANVDVDRGAGSERQELGNDFVELLHDS